MLWLSLAPLPQLLLCSTVWLLNLGSLTNCFVLCQTGFCLFICNIVRKLLYKVNFEKADHSCFVYVHPFTFHITIKIGSQHKLEARPFDPVGLCFLWPAMFALGYKLYRMEFRILWMRSISAQKRTETVIASTTRQPRRCPRTCLISRLNSWSRELQHINWQFLFCIQFKKTSRLWSIKTTTGHLVKPT